MWQQGFNWAKANHHIDNNGHKNIDGGKVGKWLASIGGSSEAAEGIKYFLLN